MKRSHATLLSRLFSTAVILASVAVRQAYPVISATSDGEELSSQSRAANVWRLLLRSDAGRTDLAGDFH